MLCLPGWRQRAHVLDNAVLREGIQPPSGWTSCEETIIQKGRSVVIQTKQSGQKANGTEKKAETKAEEAEEEEKICEQNRRAEQEVRDTAADEETRIGEDYRVKKGGRKLFISLSKI